MNSPDRPDAEIRPGRRRRIVAFRNTSTEHADGLGVTAAMADLPVRSENFVDANVDGYLG
jgi:hypothetical protein